MGANGVSHAVKVLKTEGRTVTIGRTRMPATETSAEAVRDQLGRILCSAGFVRNERLSRFLRFVVEQKLSGKAGDVKESLVAVEVFGRRPDYNPRRDAVVRAQAARLRSR